MQSKLWFFLICKMFYECVKRPKKGPKQIPKKGPQMAKLGKTQIWPEGPKQIAKKG